MEDMEIVALYWARSEDAIAETAEKYGGYCHSISFGILRNEQDAEECVTDTYYRAWNTMPPKRPDRLAAFLGKITRNLSLDRYRRRTAKMRGRGQVTMAQEELEQSVPSHDSVEDQLSAAALTDSLNRFLCGLRPGKPAGCFGENEGNPDGRYSFLDVGLGEKIHIQELNRVVSSDASIDVAISSFTVIDLDEDGIDEVVLWLAAGEEEVGCEILHGVNDEIYGYFIPYRGFYNLKADGTFRFSSGAGNSGIGTIKFDLQAYTVEKITYSETQYDERNQAEASFVVNGHASRYEDFEAEMEKQDEKKDAETYAFTDDHVEKYLS